MNWCTQDNYGFYETCRPSQKSQMGYKQAEHTGGSNSLFGDWGLAAGWTESPWRLKIVCALGFAHPWHSLCVNVPDSRWIAKYAKVCFVYQRNTGKDKGGEFRQGEIERGNLHRERRFQNVFMSYHIAIWVQYGLRKTSMGSQGSKQLWKFWLHATPSGVFVPCRMDNLLVKILKWVKGFLMCDWLYAMVRINTGQPNPILH